MSKTSYKIKVYESDGTQFLIKDIPQTSTIKRLVKTCIKLMAESIQNINYHNISTNKVEIFKNNKLVKTLINHGQILENPELN